MTKSITDRLENWAIWARGQISAGGADCMTDEVCGRLRDAALGNVWNESWQKVEIDEVDAVRVELAWRTLEKRHQEILRWTFINNARPEVVCRMLGIKARPHHFFVEAFNESVTAIDKMLDIYQSENKIPPTHNLIPSRNSTSDFTQGTALSEKTESPA